jgi:hypothetical protein
VALPQASVLCSASYEIDFYNARPPLPLEPSTPCAPQSLTPSKPSRQKNAQAISKIQAIELNFITL